MTVPIEVRRKLGLQPGDELIFEVRDGELHARGLKRRRLSELRGALEATRPFADIDTVRDETGRRLGEQVLARTGHIEAGTAHPESGADKS